MSGVSWGGVVVRRDSANIAVAVRGMSVSRVRVMYRYMVFVFLIVV